MPLLRKHWFCTKLNSIKTLSERALASVTANERSELEGGNWQSEALVSTGMMGAQLRPLGLLRFMNTELGAVKHK